MDSIPENEWNIGRIHSSIRFKTMFSSVCFWTQIKVAIQL